MKTDYQKEIDSTFKEADYVGRKTGFRVTIVLLLLIIFCGLGGIVYTRTIGKAEADARRDVFKETTAYTEQAASFLAKEYKEYYDSDDKSDKNTIMEYVIMRYPNLDTDNIDNDTLKQFYLKCLNN